MLVAVDVSVGKKVLLSTILKDDLNLVFGKKKLLIGVHGGFFTIEESMM